MSEAISPRIVQHGELQALVQVLYETNAEALVFSAALAAAEDNDALLSPVLSATRRLLTRIAETTDDWALRLDQAPREDGR